MKTVTYKRHVITGPTGPFGTQLASVGGLEDFAMFRRFEVFAAALLAFAMLLPTHGFASPTPIAQAIVVSQALPPVFETEDAAQTHCPRDVVVWLNVPSGIYHYKGERWYGRTKHGVYACEKEAIKAGDRASENGQ